MQCENVKIQMPEGYSKDVKVCTDVEDLPYHIKGMTNKEDLILINKYLGDLNIGDPKLYVLIHETIHVKYPQLPEYQVRRIADRVYKRRTGEEIDTTGYLSFAENLESIFGAA